ncbi:MAG: anti-sigma factor [Chloroflexus sp.]|uniref:anti-sigma factor family protein n=1 Tax=Chloroflexus sp. TaxID=1904827 RepID=UPI0021DC0D2A|nr:zf-HC2 domain-containing protein [Chloroflexus sp.]GIV89573.1 MAG: anti-sigma factor [Chloroflexus sp.]
MEHFDHHHCLDLIDALNDYLDGELSATSCAELEEHLRRCPECQEILDSLRQTVELLHHLDDVPPPLPPALEERLIDQMQRRLQNRRAKAHTL